MSKARDGRKTKAKTVVKFGLAISNNGDGSVSPRLFKTYEEALAFEDKQDESWGEHCSCELELCFNEKGELMGYDEDGYEEY